MRKLELINLTLDEIRKASGIVNEVCNDTKRSYYEEENEVQKNIIVDCEKILEEIRIKLRDTLGYIITSQDVKDMLTEVDYALSKLPNDLIFGHKTDEDFES